MRETFYMVVKKGQVPNHISFSGGNYITRKYDMFGDAVKEAERLCEKENDYFYVTEAIAVCEPEVISVKWCNLSRGSFPPNDPLDCCGTDGCKTDQVRYSIITKE